MTLVCLEQKLMVFFLLFLHHLVLENVDRLARLWLFMKSHIIFLESAEPCLFLFVSLKKYFLFDVDIFHVSSDNLYCCKYAGTSWYKSN